MSSIARHQQFGLQPRMVLFAIAGLTLVELAIAPPSLAESEAELLRLCSKFPYNSRCEGREPVVLFGDRPGETIENCQLKIGLSGSGPFAGDCKVERTETDLNLYIAQSDRRDTPKDELYSIALRIPLDQIIATDQNIATRTGAGFGPDYYSITQIAFIEPNPKADKNRTNVVRIQGGRNFGTELSRWLESGLGDRPSDNSSTLAQRLAPETTTPEPIPATLQANIAALLATRACVRCDLRGADLAGQNLGRVNLEGANLSEANLTGTNLGESYLMGAQLDRAQLQGAQLSEAWGIAASLREADLSDAKLHNLFFQAAVFDRARLTNAKFDRLNQITPLLQRTSFVEANLEGASFEGANLSAANFENANLAGAKLSREPVKVNTGGFLSAVLVGSSTQTNQAFSTILIDANFSGANLQNANLHYAQMENANFSNANLSEANLNKSYLVNANLSNSNLQSSRMTYINLSNANLLGANTSQVDFNQSRLCGVTMPDGTVSQTGCE